MAGQTIASVPSSLARGLARAAVPLSWMCLGFVTVGAVAAAAAYLPFNHDRSGIAPKPMRSEAQRSEALGAQARASSFVQRWHEEWKQIDARDIAMLRKPRDTNWLWTDPTPSPYATRFTLNFARAPGTLVATRLPLVRPDGIERELAVSPAPQVSDQRLAALPPQPQAEPPQPGILDRMFGDPDRAAKAVLAAHPNKALYDITKRVVYLPDGTKLEAHSGFGEFMDDPDSVHRKNVGVTPPNVYAVSFREKPFHGVRALRMKPVGEGNMYGRDGILAHSFLLGEAGASNGCISVREYDKFLKAYEDGLFNQIIVLRSIDEPVPRLLASAQ